MPHTPTISIRAATAADSRALTRLAALDSASIPLGPTLVAEVDGEPKAALAVREGRAVADPFAPTADLVALLRLHAESVAPRAERRRAESPLAARLRVAA